jgi:hypothetical protein
MHSKPPTTTGSEVLFVGGRSVVGIAAEIIPLTGWIAS